MSKTVKYLDATSGSAEFKTADQILDYRVVIEGNPGANIKVFYHEKENGFNGYFLKVLCSNWNGAVLKLQAKTKHEDDSFSDTGDQFKSDDLMQFKYN